MPTIPPMIVAVRHTKYSTPQNTSAHVHSNKMDYRSADKQALGKYGHKERLVQQYFQYLPFEGLYMHTPRRAVPEVEGRMQHKRVTVFRSAHRELLSA